MANLIINNINISVDHQPIIYNLTLTIKPGEVHVLMGPNGAGKSTLCKALMGHPKYHITSGSVTLGDKDLLSLSVSDRSKAGLFLVMQHPMEIPGVKNSDFIRTALSEHRGQNVDIFQFVKEYEEGILKVKLSEEMAERYLNVGFSGGEMKRNEILQLLMLHPKIALIDEVDSGVDVDGVKVIGKVLQDLVNQKQIGLLIVTHNDRLSPSLKASHVHILKEGQIVLSGNNSLLSKINKKGYEWIK